VAQEIREFAVLVPAGTAKTSPLVSDISFPERAVIAVSWRVPPGPSGLMGWALTSAGTPVIPIQQGTYVVTDNQSATWPLEGYLDSGNWQVTAYNLGLYDHTVYLTFLLDLPGSVSVPTPPPTGYGAGVIGTGGTVTVPPAPVPPPPVVTTPDDTAAAVTSAVLAAFAAQLQAAAAS
jgi:hypothetical protein